MFRIYLSLISHYTFCSHSLSLLLPLVSLSSLDTDESTASTTNGHKVKSAECAELNKNKMWNWVSIRLEEGEAYVKAQNATATPNEHREANENEYEKSTKHQTSFVL